MNLSSLCMGAGVHKTGNRRAVEVPAAAATTLFNGAFSIVHSLQSDLSLSLSLSFPPAASSFSVRSGASKKKICTMRVCVNARALECLRDVLDADFRAAVNCAMKYGPIKCTIKASTQQNK